jgi:hypothetical protein
MKLVYEGTGKPVKVGDKVKTYQGPVVTVLGILAPRHGGSTGRVVVRERGYERTYFPSVIDAHWVGREDQENPSESPTKFTRDWARKLAKQYGFTVKKTEYDEYRVNLIGGTEASAAYETDIQHAVYTGIAMRKHRDTQKNPRTCECGMEATEILQGDKGPLAYMCPSCIRKYSSMTHDPYTKVEPQDPLIRAPWNIRRDSVTKRWVLLKHNEVMLTARTKPELLRKIELGTSYTKKYQQNPKHTLIYGKVNRIVATKTQQHQCDAACKRHGHRYYHDFSSRAQMYGLPDGSLLIKSK